VSDSPGKFSARNVKATGAHQTAENKDDFPLPDTLEYEVPPELGKSLRDPSMNTVDPNDASTHPRKEVATLIYMDVGRWSGSAPTKHDTQSHWGKHRDFGIVHGRLAALCTYTKETRRDGKDGPVIDDAAVPLESTHEFEKILPLLKTLSSNPALGRVQVTKAVLGRKLNNEIPKKDRIYVILGDLHAPVMTDVARTYSEVPRQKSLPDPGFVVQGAPGAFFNAGLATGAIKRGPRPSYEWRGRYNPGDLARYGLPVIARIVGGGAKLIVNADPVTIKITEAMVARTVLEAPLLAAPVAGPAIALGEVTSGVLTEIALRTALPDWPDPDQGDADSVKDWFTRYHGTLDKKGADIFEDAGADLLLWLTLLKEYQKQGGTPPVRLMQLGDLFDFWIGLKCPFSLLYGAKSFLKKSAAQAFLKCWMDEALRSPAIKYLWNFDANPPAVPRADLNTVFLYGNHDMYMGSLLQGHELLKERFDKDPGLVAQHGHQEDTFNKERNAGLGYLLTQAAFSDDYVRGIEDPVSALGPTLFGGGWTRLALAEMALKTCIFDRVNSGKQPALTFVMGHTHEPVLQVIHVVARREDKSRATSTATGTQPSTATGTQPSAPGSTATSTGMSTATGTATGTESRPK